MKTLISYDSLGGNTKSVADYISKLLPSSKVATLEDDFEQYDVIVLGSYTWGNGKIPKKYKDFVIDNAQKLQNKKVFIFGTGNTLYPNFCGAVDGLNKICSESGADVISSLKLELSLRNNERSVETFVRKIEEYL